MEQNSTRIFPNFRPTFRYYCWQSSLLGTVLTVAVMFYLNPTYAAVTYVVVLCLFIYISFKGPVTAWGDISQALLFHQARTFLLRLQEQVLSM